MEERWEGDNVGLSPESGGVCWGLDLGDDVDSLRDGDVDNDHRAGDVEADDFFVVQHHVARVVPSNDGVIGDGDCVLAKGADGWEGDEPH